MLNSDAAVWGKGMGEETQQSLSQNLPQGPEMIYVLFLLTKGKNAYYRVD